MDVRRRMREHPLVIRSALQRPWTGRAAWILVGLEALLYPVTLYLGLTASAHVVQLLQFGWWGVLSPLLGIEFALVGALILHRHPGHGVGVIAVVGGFCMVLSTFAGAYAAYSLTAGHNLPATGLATWLRGGICPPALTLLFVVLPALFPDGRLPSRRWRPMVWAVAAGATAQFTWVSLSQLMFGRQIVDGPYPTDAWLFDVLTALAAVLFILPLFSSVAALAVRFRRSRGVERQQLKWFLAAVGLESAVWAGALLASVFTRQSAAYQIPYFDVVIP